MKIKEKARINSGITLIALVITIIILLILAGISIATLTGEDGILTRANDAKEQTEIGEEKEAIGLAYNGVVAENEGEGVTANQLQDELRNNGYTNATAEPDGENIKVTFSDTNRTYTIDGNGKISGPEEGDIIAKMTIAGEKVTTVPIPDGFVHVGGNINDGYVISDNSEDENKGVNNEELKGNQFVWVPVDRNQKITVNVISKENIESILLEDPFGEKLLNENVGDKKYNNTNITPTTNGTYILTVKSEHNKTKKVYLFVTSLYAKNSFLNLNENFINKIIDDIEKNAKENGFENIDKFLEAMSEEMGFEVTLDYIINYQLKAEIEETKNCVDTEPYTDLVNEKGGFYIGRYEASYENEKAVSKKSTSYRIKESTQLKNGMLWNNISKENALAEAKKLYNGNFKSSLLTGSAWDRTLGWLYETGDKTFEEIVEDSTDWGKYNGGGEFFMTPDLINTGSLERTRANNIFDLAGNLGEFTAEIKGTGICSIRGGYSIYGVSFPASHRGENWDHTSLYSGFRVALY